MNFGNFVVGLLHLLYSLNLCNLIFSTADSINFTIKLYHGGEFDEKFEKYTDGEFKYFDMCSPKDFKLFDLRSMCEEIGIGEGCYDLWFKIPHQPLSAEMLLPLDSEKDVGVMVDLLIYSNCMEVYTSAKDQGEDDMFDFSFTQYAEDERERRVGEMYDELEEGEGEAENEGEGEAANEELEDDVSFHGDSSNLDSSESEVEPPPKKKRRIPPPNQPFRLRKRGRYSMLRV